MDTFEGACGKLNAPMNKTTTLPLTETTPAVPAVPRKRYDDAFKQAAVANWIKTGQSGTKIAAELGISYPSLKEWKRRYWGDATPRAHQP